MSKKKWYFSRRMVHPFPNTGVSKRLAAFFLQRLSRPWLFRLNGCTVQVECKLQSNNSQTVTSTHSLFGLEGKSLRVRPIRCAGKRRCLKLKATSTGVLAFATLYLSSLSLMPEIAEVKLGCMTPHLS